ncbi:MAG: 4Fe-4S dicluster domain-containing protein [Spirochaetes bacterium]|nr:4Fe-4S dicluster domain-containing protein [Spirochaetota bacterium]
MQYKILKKSNLDNLISMLSKKQKVMAPVKKGENNYVFDSVTSAKNISLEYIPTILPPKKYFMPQHETLVEYDTKDGQKMEAVVEYEDMILFGIHTCDLAGIQCLNIVFSDRPKDLNYLVRKNRITIIGLECNGLCDEHATCALMDNDLPNGGYDLFFTDLGDYFIVHVNTLAGDKIIEKSQLFEDSTASNIKELEKLRERKRSIFVNKFGIDHQEIPALFDKSKESQIWHDIGERCLSCGNCTNVCPTCYCFDVMDIPNLDLKTGKRIRVWDSCQNEPFAKVSGGESFREDRADRKKHRFYRKFEYPVNKYSRFFCTGCGRCTRACMAKISLPETLEQLIKENSTK